MGNNYKQIVEQENSKIFFQKLTNKLDKELTNYFGVEDAEEIFTELKNGRITIRNAENFLLSYENIGDTSLSFCNKYKNFEEFIQRAIVHFKDQAEKGNKQIIIREFFVGIAHLIGNKTKFDKSIEERLYASFKNFILSLSSNSSHPPYLFKIPNYKMASELAKILKLQTFQYAGVLHVFTDCYAQLIHNKIVMFYPNVDFVYTVYKDSSENQIKYLKSIFPSENKASLRKYLKSTDITQNDEIELQIMLETLAQKNKVEIDIQEALENLQQIDKKEPLKTYSNIASLYLNDKNKGVGSFHNLFKWHRVSKSFVARTLYNQTFQPYCCDISINCENLSTEEIDFLIDKAKKLCLIKEYTFKNKKVIKAVFKITLENVKEFSQNFIDFVENKQRKLQSSLNKDFVFEISFNINKATQKRICNTEEDYIRVISDIHADYNARYNYKFDFGDDLVINCGDTAGDGLTAREWCKNNMKRGIVVMGNHLGYSAAYPELEEGEQREKNMELFGSPHHVNNTKNSQMLIISKSLTGKRGIRFLSNSECRINDIIVLGTCLYTDFKLYGENLVEKSMDYARRYMNDFKLIHVVGHREYKWTPEGWKVKMRKREKSKIRLFTPEDHAYYFHYSLNFLKEKVEEYKNEKIIILTHFAPSPYAISPQYTNNPLNPAFVSNLNDFIISNPQIRLWTFGHVHTPCDFILGQTRLVCNPFGYNNENNADLPNNYGTRIALKDINSDEPWTKICREEIKEGKIKVYEN